MTWLDIGIGVCNCGVERRLFQPEVGRAECSVCVIAGVRTLEAKEMVTAEAEAREAERKQQEKQIGRSTPAVRSRRVRLQADGKCIDCGKLPPMNGVRRCMRCHQKMLGNRKTAIVRSVEAVRS